MNRRKVIFLTTVGVFLILTTIAAVFFKGLPPWPVLFWFAVSHAFFCFIIARVKPYRGPYTEPMEDPTIETHRT